MVPVLFRAGLRRSEDAGGGGGVEGAEGGGTEGMYRLPKVCIERRKPQEGGSMRGDWIA